MKRYIVGRIEKPTDGEIYFTADWHFGDDRMQILGRPFSTADECAEHMVAAANSRLKENDLLVVNGDVAMTEADLKWVSKIAGRKVLIIGNKDTFGDDAYEAAGFYAVYQEGAFVEIDGQDYYVTHYPTRADADYFNLTGHIHHSWRVQKNMLNVGVDANHFLPLSEEDVKFAVTAVTRFYDRDVWVGDSYANTAHAARGKAGRYNTDPILVEGNLLNFPAAQVIGHQTNCFSTTADQCGGLANVLFRQMPWAMPSDVSGRLYGGYRFIANQGVEVVNLYGQYNGGPCTDCGVDSEAHRLNALRAALFSFISIEEPASLALPYRIGCGIAGGNWDRYHAMLKDIAALFPDTIIYLVKLPDEQW